MVHRVVIYAGQSQVGGISSSSVPGGIPNSGVRFWRYKIAPLPVQDNVTQALKVTTAAELGGGGAVDIHGPALQLGTDLLAGGWTDLTIVNCWRNGSYIRHWADGAAQLYWRNMTSLLYGAMPANTSPYFYFIWDQGESEAQDTDPTFKNEWASKYTTIHSDLQTLVGQNLLRLITPVRAGLSGTWTTEMHDTIQPGVADATVSQDDCPVEADNIHRSPIGNNTVGARWASYLLSL